MNKKNSRGSLSIEAALIMPVVIFLLVSSLLSFQFIEFTERMSFKSLQIERAYWQMRFLDDQEEDLEKHILVQSQTVVNNLKASPYKVIFHHQTSNDKKQACLYMAALYPGNLLGPKTWTFLIPMNESLKGDGLMFNGSMVYITRTGERYHASTCYHLRKSKFEISLKEARKRGYTPCKHCILKNSK